MSIPSDSPVATGMHSQRVMPHAQGGTVQNAAVHEGRSWSCLSSSGNLITEIALQIFSLLSDLLRLLWEDIMPNSRLVTERYGCGIFNGSSSCYMNSSLQWLRKLQDGIIPPREESLPQGNARGELAGRMRDFFQIIEGPASRNASVSEVNQFRGFCLQHGFAHAPSDIHDADLRASYSWGQQDASEFLGFIFDTLQMQPIRYATSYEHNLGISLRKMRDSHTDAHLLNLSLGNAQDGTHLSALFQHHEITDTFSLGEVAPQDRSRLLPEIRSYLQSDARAAIPFTVRQTIKLSEHTCPPVLPVVLGRFSRERDGSFSKRETKILPSLTLDIPLIENPRRYARYVLQAAICHTGNYGAGHNYTYTLQLVDGRLQYVQFDDSSVNLRQEPHTDHVGIGTSAYDDLARNGYIYGYRFQNFVQHD